MSPQSTLNSCGSSSSDVRRRHRPTGVTRGSFEILNTGPSTSLRSSSMDWSCSALTTIVRNFNIRKRRRLRPKRSWAKKIGPGLVIFTATAAATREGSEGCPPADDVGCDTRRRRHRGVVIDEPDYLASLFIGRQRIANGGAAGPSAPA